MQIMDAWKKTGVIYIYNIQVSWNAQIHLLLKVHTLKAVLKLLF